MISLEERIKALVRFGEKLDRLIKSDSEAFQQLLQKVYQSNSWFTHEYVIYSLQAIAAMLREDNLYQWVSRYDLSIKKKHSAQKILVVMAGNIPAVGFHDFISVLVTGHVFIGKLSSDDKILLPALAEMLTESEPPFSGCIEFIEGKTHDFDAVIATGSDNTSRYFDYYFGKYPHIIRRNRNSIAVLTGQEGMDELEGLSDDICLYFGLGCRNVSKIFVPENYDFQILFSALNKYNEILSNCNKYMNNYEYTKTLFLLNNTPFLENEYMLLTENTSLSSPVSVVNYQRYSDISEVEKYIRSEKDKLQCVVGNPSLIKEAVPFGKSQQPELWDYADGVDTIKFLL